MPTAKSRVALERDSARPGDTDLLRDTLRGGCAGDENVSISSISVPSAEFIHCPVVMVRAQADIFLFI
jgi:hypothetical protein